MSTTTTSAETRQVNGQIELADPASITSSPYANAELVPVPLNRRTWTTYNYVALGTIAGVLIAGYWVRSRTRLSLGALYTRGSRCCPSEARTPRPGRGRSRPTG
jgi:cytosine/uracil/thiamine/allantoin permease